MPIEVDYLFPPGIDPVKQSKIIAIGQTAGTWDARFAHREQFLREHLAQVVATNQLPSGQSLATIAFPEANVEGDIGSLLTMIFGKYSMAGPAKVAAVRLPDSYGVHPNFGINGIRAWINVRERPLIMAIFKPALGLSSDDHANILEDVARAGLDIIKDDEIMGDLPVAPTLERLAACRKAIDRVQKDTGKLLMYAVNVTGKADTLLERARQLVSAGANALLLNVLSYGYSTLEALAQDPTVGVPIFAHPALAGAMCGSPDYGLSYSVVLGTLMGHAGADAVLYPAHYGSLPFDANEEAKIRDELRRRDVFPVPSAGIHPGIVPRAIRDYGSDVILNAGTGIMDHPDGPAAGVRAFYEAIDRFANKEEFTVEATPPGPLKRALEKWGT